MPWKRWPLPDVDDHNGPQFLVVKFCELLTQPKYKYHIGRHKLLHPGWFVVRTCPCHFGERVTISHPTRESAEESRRKILSVNPL